MTGGEYEKVVREIVESIVTQFNIPQSGIGHGKRNRLKGASGYSHQIDVTARGSKDLVLIECKWWKKRVSLEKVLVLVGRIFDIWPTLPVDVGVQAYVVSKERVTRPAAKVATHFRIEVAQVSTPQEFVLKYKNRWNLGLADTSEGILTDDFRFRMNP